MLLFAEVEDLHHVGVVEQGGQLGLVVEHLQELRILAQVGQDHFEDEQLGEPGRTGLAREVNLGHPTRGQLAQDGISGQNGPILKESHRAESINL